MVSLSEHFMNGFPVYDKSLIEKIYSKLGDPMLKCGEKFHPNSTPRQPNDARSGRARNDKRSSVYRSVPANLRPDLLALTEQG